MPTVILTEPFIRHYAGSVFHLDDAIGISGWDDDDRIRDRQPCHDKRVYALPDNGKGIACELPIDYTILCPEDIFIDENIKSGPCRITSVSESLEEQQNDPFYASPLPKGKGKVLLHDSSHFTKNVLEITIPSRSLPNKVVIQNMVDHKITEISVGLNTNITLDFSTYDPGFYKVEIFNNTILLHYFTVIKCFPLVVFYDFTKHKYKMEKTLW